MRASQTSVVVVNWNGATFLPELLASIEEEAVVQIVAIDNASSDDSLRILREHSKVVTISNPDNRGYGAAANQGLETCTTPYVLLLNADVKVLAGSIGIMEKYMEAHPDVAVVAPQLLFGDGSLQPSIRSFPTALSIALYLSYLDRIFTGHYRMKHAEHGQIQNVDQPMGAAMMIRRAVLEKIGLFDPQFFLYMEEVDLCYRIKQNGYKIVYLPDAQMIHYAGGSSQQDWERSQRNFLDSVALYFRKHAPEEARKLRWLLSPALVLRALVLLLSGRFRQSKFYFSQAL